MDVSCCTGQEKHKKKSILLLTDLGSMWVGSRVSSELAAAKSKVTSLMSFLKNVPSAYREGPWHPAAMTVLVLFTCFLLNSFNEAHENYNQFVEPVGPEPQWLDMYRLTCGIYCVLITCALIYSTGIWPLCSYTITSWNLLTIRLLTSCTYFSKYTLFNIPVVKMISRIVKFPALVGCSITVSVWWIVLVPLVYHLIGNDHSKRNGFTKFNSSFVLVNIHALNLPIMLIEFLCSKARLTFFDLWAGFLFAFMYVIFYLAVLDRNGIHLYIVFTPRTIGALVTYPLVLLTHALFFILFNYSIEVIQYS